MIDRTLFVILGAGASYDASEYYGSVESRPPLTAGLFARRFDPILEDYPMAVNAAPDIRDAISGAGAIPAVSLEDHLRLRYAESADEYDKRRYLSLPLYLQHVLLSVSGRGVPQSHHFDRLLNRLVGSFDVGVGSSDVPRDLVGVEGQVRRALLPSGTVYAAGEEWTARTADGRSLERGTAVRIRGREGLVLIVDPVPR